VSSVFRWTLHDTDPITEKLGNTERHLDVSKGHVNRVEDKQDELKQLNRSIFRPVIHFNKEGKRQAQEAKLLARHEEEREEHEKAMMEVRDSQGRIGKGLAYRGRDDEDDEEGIGGYGSGRFKPPVDQAKRKAERSRYQFEATASDDELEDELDDNLNEISDMTKRLKALGSAMGQELDNQNTRLDKMGGKVDGLDNKLQRGIQRVCISSHLLNYAPIFCPTVRQDQIDAQISYAYTQRNYSVTYCTFTYGLFWSSRGISTVAHVDHTDNF